ncbi:MAG: hypothetical protein AAF990_26225 [Bacteroidota bacterium]
MKKFTIAQKFLNKGEREEGMRLVKQAHRIAINYDFVHLACETSSILCRNHAFYQVNKNKAIFFARLNEEYLRNYAAEKKAENEFYLILGNGEGISDIDGLRRAIENIKAFPGDSVNYHFYRHRLTVLYGFQINDYHLVIEQCTAALQFFKGKKGVYGSSYQFFYSKQALAQMALSQYQAAGQNLQQAAQYAPAKSLNDYILRLYTTLNALHSGQYQLAYDLYRKNRKCRFENIREQFAIIEAYLCFLSHEGQLQLQHTFRLGKYLNETFRAQANKQGDNVAILIAELLVLLVRDRNRFIDRVEEARRYSYRHLKGSDTRRAKLFIKILTHLPRANFHPTTFGKIARPLIDQLDELPIHMGHNVLLEIVPFHVLLQMILIRKRFRIA